MYKNLFTSKTFKRILVKLREPPKYSSHTSQEHQIVIDGQTINYIRQGYGNIPLLCFPGALGSIWSDFKPQIEKLDKSKFTIFAWDPPGYGSSRPPLRNVSKDFYERDADVAVRLMDMIGVKKYSLLGWSDGGVSSLIISAKYPEKINHLIIWGSNARIMQEDIDACEKIRDITIWSDKMKSPLIKLYGENEFQQMWNEWLDTLNIIFKQGGNICEHLLPSIQCPTLILHGNKDTMIAKEHPYILLKKIKNAKLHQFAEGKHNIHLRYADEFNEIVTRFIEENNEKFQ
ncbi:hypothetical protein FQA39_LY02298 [Lamprigera yunnana]|nr:hypothetical protein FQA39_LY02298 [Lamprigera yunnana]